MRTVGLSAFATAAPKRKGQKEEAAPAVAAQPIGETAAEGPGGALEAPEPPAAECGPEGPARPAAENPAPKRKGQKAAGDAA